LGEQPRGGVGADQLRAPRSEQLALPFHQHAVPPRVAVDLEGDPLGHPLGVLDGPADPRIVYPPVRPHLAQRRYLLGRVPGDQVVLDADEEHRAARVALPPGPAAQLVVDPATVVPAAADHVQPAQVGDPVAARLVPAAEPDVDPPAGHLRRHGDRARPAGLGDDLRLLGVVAGVEHHALDARGASGQRRRCATRPRYSSTRSTLPSRTMYSTSRCSSVRAYSARLTAVSRSRWSGEYRSIPPSASSAAAAPAWVSSTLRPSA